MHQAAHQAEAAEVHQAAHQAVHQAEAAEVHQAEAATVLHKALPSENVASYTNETDTHRLAHVADADTWPLSARWTCGGKRIVLGEPLLRQCLLRGKDNLNNGQEDGMPEHIRLRVSVKNAWCTSPKGCLARTPSRSDVKVHAVCADVSRLAASSPRSLSPLPLPSLLLSPRRHLSPSPPCDSPPHLPAETLVRRAARTLDIVRRFLWRWRCCNNCLPHM